MGNPATMPSVAIPRSRFRQEFCHNTSWQHGTLIPLDCFPVLPGDDFSVHKAALEVIMSTPIAPIFGNIKAKVTAFFVPMRLLWEHTEEFFGANKTTAGPQSTPYYIPHVSLFSTTIGANSVSHYLGKPVIAADPSKTIYAQASVLKERGYWFIWSEWYRAQQLQDPFIMWTGDAGSIGNISGTAKTFGSLPARVCKQIDLFTAATLYPQYSLNAVTLPMGTYAPLKVVDPYSIGGDLNFASNYAYESSGLKYGLRLHMGPSTDTHHGDLFVDTADSGSNSWNNRGVNYLNIAADLSNATAATINQIRYAFQLQKYLERANYGSRFFEVLAVHYGVTSPDSRLQRPEYLGGKTCPIIVRTVLSQAGYDAGVGQKVGQPGASSITYMDLSGLFSKGFVEPGFVYIMLSTNHERLYSQGLMREDTLFDHFEFYSPEFANLGDQAILNQEIMVTGDSTDKQVFGYQGHWDELRYRKNRVSGILDPAVSGALDYWTLAEKFTTRPSLSASFIEENRDCISRCLVTGSNGPDYIGDFYIEYAATRELPLYNIPGLVDHFGAL